MNKNLTHVLIHSPLVGPLTWQLIHDEMHKRGIESTVPTLSDHPNSALPYWRQHAEAAASDLAQTPQDRSVVLVAHSGAGPLMPIIRQSVERSIKGYVFVDAGIPRDGMSRMDLMSLEDPEWAEQFHQMLLQGGRFPDWNENDLQEAIPNHVLRQRMASEINPRPLSFFTEPIPVFDGWPDAPCAYIKFSASYNWDFEQAKQAGWFVREVDAGHFHMLVDPSLVTNEIVNAAQEITN